MSSFVGIIINIGILIKMYKLVVYQIHFYIDFELLTLETKNLSKVKMAM